MRNIKLFRQDEKKHTTKERKKEGKKEGKHDWWNKEEEEVKEKWEKWGIEREKRWYERRKKILLVWLFGFQGISTFIGHLMPNPFLYE